MLLGAVVVCALYNAFAVGHFILEELLRITAVPVETVYTLMDGRHTAA